VYLTLSVIGNSAFIRFQTSLSGLYIESSANKILTYILSNFDPDVS